ncbi:MAG: sarcosine oxidase subunit delta [Candidatus Competibacterales bacterium]|nr:sarcosine oxidase subunit delta [Candidatus Competibacterales bacterium]
MLRIPCPWCGERDHTEFSYGGDATRRRPDPTVTDPQIWYAYVYIRDNPRGRHHEYWRHSHGCGQWLRVERDTLTHAVGAVRFAAELEADQ